MPTPSAKDLRTAIVRSLRKQGYLIKRGLICMPRNPTKDDYRDLNQLAVKKRIEKSAPDLQRYEDDLLTKFIANGREVVPSKISPKVILVEPDSVHELLFRYASLHWSIPVL